ncbi:2-oxo acid dehydrogenase subunit E2, partial [Candidatus Poribacteria bacterium]|nr:2-oxo acid dehydrogenase subunit E2 [Candidatus Poribacteria bacterium]
PRFGWTMEEGTFVEWLKQDGETVQPGDILFTIESDKALNEVESFDSGILRIPPDAPPPGATVSVGTRLAYLVQPGELAPFEAGGRGSSRAHGMPETDTTQRPGAPVIAGPQGAASPQLQIARSRKAGPTISPRALRVAVELGVDWSVLRGSGRTGRIVERDIRAASVQKPVRRRREEIAPARVGPTIVAPLPPVSSTGETIPVTQIRRLIAQRMVESAHTTAPVTLTTEADATALVVLREQLKATFTPRGITVPTYSDLIIKLTAAALREHPMLNACWKEDEIILMKEIHIGVAVDTEAGVLVPVIRDVQAKGLRQIAEDSHSLAEKARSRRLRPEDMQGGTFTITNLGMYGVDAFTPIINLPQCAILGVGRIVSKPAVYNDQIVPRQMMGLSLTFDHRVVDGAPAARFLETLRQHIEDAGLWLLA